jgi:catechol 2,3-dioxygenase-like lactoylglutathione lyase family enzyme
MKSPAAVGLLLAVSLSASTQLTTPNAVGMSMGHVHLNVADAEIQKRLWVHHFGATPIAADGVSGVKLPGMLILFEQRAQRGGSQGTVMDHFGLKVRDLASTLAAWRAAGYAVQREFKGTEGFPNAYLMGPDQVRLELQEDTTLTARAIAYHLHYFLDSPAKLRDWYVQTLAMESGKRGDHETANLPAFNLSFTASKSAQRAARGRSIDHVGFEVRNLEAFCRTLEAAGVTFDVPYRRERSFASAFLTDPYGVSIELTEGLAKL